MTQHRPTAPRWRLFAAAPLPETAALELWSSIEPLRLRYPEVRWARREQLHDTLVFLGQVDPSDVDRLTRAMSVAAAQHAPFEVETSGAGGRVDDRRGGVAWLRLTDRRRHLRNLARELDWRFETNIFKTGRPRPHVTVARRIDEAFLDALRDCADELRLRWRFDRVVLYRSHGEPGGSRYEALAERLLTGTRAT